MTGRLHRGDRKPCRVYARQLDRASAGSNPGSVHHRLFVGARAPLGFLGRVNGGGTFCACELGRNLERWIPSPEQTPNACDSGKGHTKQNNYQRNLQPDEAANFPKDEFNSRTPWTRNAIADGFHSSLHRALESREQLGLFVKGGRDQHPSQDDRYDAKRVHFRMMLQARISIFDDQSHLALSDCKTFSPPLTLRARISP